MKRFSISVFMFGLLIAAMPLGTAKEGHADSDDDTLKLYLSKAETVVVGEVTDGMQRIGVDQSGGTGVNVVSFEVKVTESIQGKVAAKKTIVVTFQQAIGLDRYLLKVGDKLVLFLKPAGDSFVTADKWFGATPYSWTLVHNLKRVKEESAKGK